LTCLAWLALYECCFALLLTPTQTFLKTEGLNYAVKKEDYLEYFR